MNAARRTLLAGTLATVGLRYLRPAGAAELGVLRPWEGPAAAPPIDLLLADGRPFEWSALRGKVVLVNFWATWCEPCVAEMPSLQRLRESLGPERFEVVGVNFKEGPARIEAFARKTGVRFPIVRDTDGAVTRAWNAPVFPSSFVVDRDGGIRYVLLGEAEWTSASLVSTIRALLGPPRT